MPIKIRSTSSKAMALGWLWPTLFLLAGRVTSITSAFNCSSLILLAREFLLSSSFASMTALASLTICPTLGRSSGATSFMLFKTLVNSPFFPKYATRISFNRSKASEPSICLSASSLIFSSFSLILVSFFLSVFLLSLSVPAK